MMPLTLLVAAAAPGVAQDTDAAAMCARGRIGRIVVDSYSLFSPQEIERRAFAPALTFINHARVRTREGFIRRTLLAHEGDCVNDEAIAASVRDLRAMPFIARVEANLLPLPDSSYELHVRVWDQWTTLVNVVGDIDQHPRLLGVSLSETDFLGEGLAVSLRAFQLHERRELGADFGAQNVVGTHATAWVGAGVTRTGHYANAALSQPFLSEASVGSFDASVSYQDVELPWVTGYNDITRLLLPVGERRAEVAAYRRAGVPGHLLVFGGELSLLSRTRSSALEVRNNDFDRPAPAPDSLVAMLGTQATPPSFIRAGASIGSRRIRYVEATGLDLVHGVQDVALGSDVIATAGRTLASLGSGPLSSYGSFDAYSAAQFGTLLAVSRARVDARYADAFPAGASSRWRDLRADARVQLSVAMPGTVQQTFVLATRATATAHADDFFQSMLSGYSAIRGYADATLPTGSMALGMFEDRVNLPIVHPAVDVGATMFADVGRGWASSVPFGMTTGWLGSIGTGLRLGLGARSGANARVEIAWPVESGRLGAPVLRAYLVELSARR